MLLKSKKNIQNTNNLKKFNNKNNKNIIIISCATFVIIFIIFFMVFQNNNRNYNNIKVSKNKYLVYTKTENTTGKYSKEIPFLNIDSPVAVSINKDIDAFLSSFSSSNKNIIKYEYNINGIILSLVIKVVDYDTTYAPNVYFRTYNFNLDKLEAISDEALLEFFGIDEAVVQKKIEDKFKDYYYEELKEEYLNQNECDFDCFITYRGFQGYMENIHYYVEDGKLVLFKPFIFASIYGEEEFFKDEHFKFLIANSSIK